VQRIRAALPRVLLDQVDLFEVRDREAILGNVSADAITAIRRALAIGWLEMSQHMEFCEALRDAVGRERYRALWGESAKSFCERPMLRGIIGMGRRLFVQKPRAAIRHLPAMYDIGTDGLGTLGVQSVQEDEFLATLDGFPANEFAFDNYVDGLHGALHGASEIMFPAWITRVEPTEIDETRGAVAFRYTLTRRQELEEAPR
jgi:hypothetical protein